MALTSTLSYSGRQRPATIEAGRSNAARDGAKWCRPIRVMHVMFRLQPGGMELGVVKLVNGLRGSRVSSSICSTTPATEVKRLVHPDVPVFELNRREGHDPRFVWDLYRLCRRERPDVLHTHAWGTLIEGLVAARLAGVPVVVHGEHGTLQLKPYQVRIQRWAWGLADQVLSVSRKLTERISASTAFPASRIRTIQNGVDLDRFLARERAAARDAIGVPAEALVIGTVGRLVPVKDHANLVEALSIIRDNGVDFIALIAGEGPLRQSLETAVAAHELTRRVRFLGHRADIENVFAALDVFVLPSRSEGMSNTILEAMAAGAAVVATRVGGADELVEDGRSGLLVPAEAPDALARALMEVTRSPDMRRQMGRAGRLKAETEFGLQRMLGDYEALYLELARQKRPGAEG